MQIKEITTNKKDYMDILLIGDEDKAMINKFDKETVEIKNLATYTQYQNKGYASALINFVCNKCKITVCLIILNREFDHFLPFLEREHW